MQKRFDLSAGVIIDTDPGVDDALAIMFAMQSDLHVLALSCVYGNVGLDQTVVNARVILKLLKKDRPVWAGAQKPLKVKPRPAESHGENGLGGFTLPLEQAHIPSAGEEYKKLLEEQTATIVCLGPSTNVAKLVAENPGLKIRIERIILMGGVIGEKGNVSPYAEFNVYNDPDALQIILGSGIETVIIPANVCRKVVVSRDELTGTAEISPAVLQIVESYIRHYQEDLIYGNKGGGVMYDLLNIAFLRQPDLFKTKKAHISVHTDEDEKRGWTTEVAGKEQNNNCTLVYDVDAEAVKKLFFESIRFR